MVVDFWATWCGPCVAEMPAMKKLYAEYKDKGVEFIGVSLDHKEGGLGQLKAFVAKEGIPWPQYYQGDGGTASSRRPGASTRSRPCFWSTRKASSFRSRPVISSKR